MTENKNELNIFFIVHHRITSVKLVVFSVNIIPYKSKIVFPMSKKNCM